MKLADMIPSRRRAWKALISADRQGKLATTAERARKYLDENPEDGFAWSILGSMLWRIGRFDEAARALRKAIKFIPSRSLQWPYSHMGDLYKAKGNPRAAERWYRKAVEANPKTTVHLIKLGGLLARQGRYTEAKRCHRRAIKLGIEDTDEAHYNLGLILRAEGDYGGALEHLERAIDLDPKYAEAKRARSDVFQAMKVREKLKQIR